MFILFFLPKTFVNWNMNMRFFLLEYFIFGQFLDDFIPGRFLEDFF